MIKAYYCFFFVFVFAKLKPFQLNFLTCTWLLLQSARSDAKRVESVE
jgi:hypothetical protein